MFEILKGFKSLGWDYDDTLVGHEKSELIWRFIRENPYRQKHHIVTMRTHGMQHRIFPKLDILKTGLTRAHFGYIINPSDELWSHYNDLYQSGQIDDDHPYYLFKGQQCRRLGIDVLIDDMEGNSISKRGCDHYGVPHIHPDDLI